jgi:hypothetical protein
MTNGDYMDRFAWCQAVYDVVGALCEIIRRPETTKEGIPKLVQEASDMIAGIGKNGPGAEPVEAGAVSAAMASPSEKQKQASAILKALFQGKEGRTLSEKNRNLIRNALDTMNSAGSALEDLLSTADGEKGTEGAPKKVEPRKAASEMHRALRIVDRAVEHAIHLVKEQK